MHKTAPVLVLATTASASPRILLLKSSSGWGAPVGVEGEDISSLIRRVAANVLHPGAVVEIVSGYHKTLNPETGALEVTVALTSSADVRPFPEADEWYDARFSSFEEASYILQTAQEKLLSWCERVVPKILPVSCAA